MTTGSNTSNRRVTRVCSAVTISQAAVIGSAARCGCDAWPPRPRTVTRMMSAAASIGPGLVVNTPQGSCVDDTCRAYAATGRRFPAASSTPSPIILSAPL